jgi:hypothetical protein
VEAELGKIIAYTIVALIVLVGTWFNGWLKRRALRPGLTIEASSAKARQQKNILGELLDQFGSDGMRAYLCKIHNGDHFIDGSPVLKLSRVAEITRPGVSYESERFKNVFISTIEEEMELIAKDGPSFFVVSQLPPCQFKWLCEVTGVVAGARCAVKRGTETVGTVGVDFYCDTPPANLEIAVNYAKWIADTL